MKKSFVGFSIVVFAICILIIAVLATGYWKRFFYPRTQEQIRTRIIMPRETGRDRDSGQAERVIWEESFNTKIIMEEGEFIIAVLNHEFEGSVSEDQIVAYRRPSEQASPVYIACIMYDEKNRAYRRMWDAPTAATRPETISLFTQDLIGDRNNCILITGMNDLNEHTMTIFRRNPRQTADQAFDKIAELAIDGSIVIQETGRSLAYQQGIARGVSFSIAAHGHDSTSANILDQIEITYTFNPAGERYEQSNVTRIPGSQIEQRRLRELLSGVPGVFENFIYDLWYYVSPQGTLDLKQYMYFDPSGREIIFFADETQQVFRWQNSIRTRYGLYIASQNISISTMRRFIDIELVSLDSIRLRVSEDVRLKITVSESWDGSYRRAGTVNLQESGPSIKPAMDALYDSSWGRLQFHSSGEFTLNSGGTVRKGRYVFFKVNEQNLLELRLEQGSEFAVDRTESRMVYRVDTAGNTSLNLSRVRLGAAGIQDLLEGQVTLTLAGSE